MFSLPGRLARFFAQRQYGDWIKNSAYPAINAELMEGLDADCGSSPDVERGFCGDCGAGLTYRHDGRPEIDITTCSLDAPETIPPADHSFVRSRLSWIRVADGLPEYDAVRRD